MKERPTSPRLTGQQQTIMLGMVKSGQPWQKVRASFPGLPPSYLDSHWFDWARRQAGLPPAPLPVGEPDPEPVLEDPPNETIVEKVKRKYTKRQ